MLGWDDFWAFAVNLVYAAGIIGVFYAVLNFLVSG